MMVVNGESRPRNLRIGLVLLFVLPETDTLRTSGKITLVLIVMVTVYLLFGRFSDQSVPLFRHYSLNKTDGFLLLSHFRFGFQPGYCILRSDSFFRVHISSRIHFAHSAELTVNPQHINF